MTKVRKSSMVGDMQVLAAGDMCAICQEKMHAPISLRCKHVFCEDCVSEWYAIWLVSFNPFFMLEPGVHYVYILLCHHQHQA